ncbi:4a-hydroxytetrahydrobiopterin dehydratase [Actinorugispora endophytica]|uniref:Putative pterin-4-alpha-carbinolamine dehydratase n=1 Tax=Actinorugispora endophytica TaxID=1605990 RepID=A0A4R6V3H3_9ACTN|nr:4a-hydroxytetrahydrobiopterin dehydratase [Actinorugispora endophytica]TDQ50704.1 pterin-4-alpha-carbinolamine dehydratase [Actinorugispora endophytica]
MTDLNRDPSLNAALTRLPEWERRGDVITRTVVAPSFMAGIDLVARVARAAEEADHHPDVDIRYNRVTFTLTSHDVGRLTERDLRLATRIDVLAESG